jgi:hypothetical protein
MTRKLYGILAGVVVFFAVLAADLFAVVEVSRRTDSGFLGICGPYGSDTALWIMAGFLVGGLPVAGWLGVRIGRATARGPA